MRYCFIFIYFVLFSSQIYCEQQKDKFHHLKETIIKKGLTIGHDTIKNDHKKKIKKIKIDLRNPSLIDGVLTTKEGGVITGPNLRIQAQNITYTKKEKNNKFIHTLVAEKDLLVIYQSQVFAGEKIEFDFVTQEGSIYNATTFHSPWYFSGDRIDLKQNGTYQITNVSITSCENVDSSWDIHAQKINMEKDVLAAKNIQFRFCNVPALWMPAFNINLKKYFAAPVLRYKIDWDKASGPKIGIRYRAYAYNDFALFLRFEYRLKKGPGGAIETEYFPSDKRTTFVTKNYLANDTLPSDPQFKKRYRIQGVYDFATSDDKTALKFSWDKFSDIHMPGDFKMDDFEINPTKKTEINFRHQEDTVATIFHARPRANTFETLKEDLPTLYCGIKPFTIPHVDIIMSNWIKLSYLRMAYSEHLQAHLKDIHSGRLQTYYEFYRAFYLGLLKFVPSVYATGIFYTNTPNHTIQGQGSINCNCLATTSLQRSFSRQKHIIEPYVNFNYYSPPLLNLNKQYIFNIQDGFHQLTMFKIGIKNSCFSLTRQIGAPSFTVDIFSNIFLNKYMLYVNKIYLDLLWNLPSCFFDIKTAWNIKLNNLDFSNIAFGYTINEDFALTLEWRYRSKYDWRKADHDSFILESARSFEALVTSPLSDKRQTILTHFFFRLTPHWTCNIESHHGWDRINEPVYNEFKIDMFTMLSSSWKFRISYLHTQTDDQFSCGISLIRF